MTDELSLWALHQVHMYWCTEFQEAF